MAVEEARGDDLRGVWTKVFYASNGRRTTRKTQVEAEEVSPWGFFPSVFLPADGWKAITVAGLLSVIAIVILPGWPWRYFLWSVLMVVSVSSGLSFIVVLGLFFYLGD